MQFFSILVIVLCAFVCLCYSCPKEPVPNEGYYSTKYDDIDMDEVLANERIVNIYVRCLLLGKPCSPPGCFLRVIMPDALKTKCARCTEKQKGIAKKFFQTIPSKYPEEWKKVITKWDPTGKLSRDLRDALSSSRSSSPVEQPDLRNVISSSRSGNPVELPDLRDAASSSRSGNPVELPDLRDAESSSRPSSPVALPDLRDATSSSRPSTGLPVLRDATSSSRPSTGLPVLRDATSSSRPSTALPVLRDATSSSRPSSPVVLPDLRDATSSSRPSSPVGLPVLRDATSSSKSSSPVGLPTKVEKNNKHSSLRKTITDCTETVRPLLRIFSEAEQLLVNFVHAVHGN